MIWLGVQFGFGIALGAFVCLLLIRNRSRLPGAVFGAFWRTVNWLTTLRWWLKAAIWLGPAFLLMAFGAEQIGTWLAAATFVVFLLARMLFEIHQRRRPSPRTSLDRCF
jgi:hypothetical protein